MAASRGLTRTRISWLQYPQCRLAQNRTSPCTTLLPSTNTTTPRQTSTIAPQRRHYAAPVPPDEPRLSQLPDLDSSKLTVTKAPTLKPVLPPEELVFGRFFTDHMLSVEWTASEGWLTPQITPYQNFSLDPATSVLHYAFTAFEGTKAYKDAQGRIRLFRPDKNMARLNKSAARIALPRFNGLEFVELMKKFCAMEARHIPSTKGYSLYLRPTLIGTQRGLGVGPSASALLYMIASPVGPYYRSGFKAVSLHASSVNVRAWPGGVGAFKLGANYAPCIVPQMQAAQEGYHQNVWLFKDDSAEGEGEEYVTEVGTMNLFAAFRKKDGTKELVTPPLDGTILEGVTRDSILELARERLVPEGWEVNERRYRMREVADAARDGRLLEVFGAGTAVVIAPVRSIAWKGDVIDCNLPPGEEAGELAKRLTGWIHAIQYGDEEHPWSVVAE